MRFATHLGRLLACLLVLAAVAVLTPRTVAGATPSGPGTVGARSGSGPTEPGAPTPFRASRGFRLAPSDKERKDQARKRKRDKRAAK